MAEPRLPLRKRATLFGVLWAPPQPIDVSDYGCDDQESESDDVRDYAKAAKGFGSVPDACGAQSTAKGKAAEPEGSGTPPAAQPAREARSNDDGAACGQHDEAEAQFDHRGYGDAETHSRTVLPLLSASQLWAA